MAEVNIKSDFLGIKDSESKIAVSWSWVPPPVEVITIKNLYFDMPDEYNGYINILLSNNDIIVYRCYETCTSPQVELGVVLKIDNTNNLITDKVIQQYICKYGYVAGLLKLYTDTKEGKI